MSEITKLWTTTLKRLPNTDFQSLFQHHKSSENFWIRISIWLSRRTTFKCEIFWKPIFKVLYFLEMGPIFVGSVHNFGRWHHLVKKCLFTIDAYVIWAKRGLVPNMIKNRWRYLVQKSDKGDGRSENLSGQVIRKCT